jgi:branched-chain amino acid transport system ATP-binding protein
MENNQQKDIMTIDHMTMRFGGLVAVEDFKASIEQGEILGLIGPNGAGKTTIFNVITGVYKPTHGHVYLEDKIIDEYEPHFITHFGIARTFQNIRLFKTMTVMENLQAAMHYELANTKPDKVMNKWKGTKKGATDLWFWKSIFKLGYFKKEREQRERAEFILEKLGMLKHKDEPAGSLPYGEQRKLEIARALATTPKLLLLDEPAAGMNPSESVALMNLVRKIRDEFDVTVFLIEHDMKFVMGLCERIIVLDYGREIAMGKPEEIRSNPKVIEAYLGEEWKDVVVN